LHRRGTRKTASRDDTLKEVVPKVYEERYNPGRTEQLEVIPKEDVRISHPGAPVKSKCSVEMLR